MIMKTRIGNLTSRLFQPLTVIPKNAELKHQLVPKSQKLMLDNGLIRQSSPGVFNFLPLGLRVLEKLTALADNCMESIGAQKLQLSSITDGKLWKKSGRWDSEKLESFKFKDRHNKDFLLSPTHEESITAMVASLPTLSYKTLPLLLYQVTNKYRDELKPRCGLIRSREFIMKDLYSFDTDETTAQQTYFTVLDAYKTFFDQLSLPYIVALSCSGEMGGNLSHEFHYPCDIGEDTVRKCKDCSHAFNIEMSELQSCMKCGSPHTFLEKTIEVGHTFLLGTKYSDCLNAFYKSKEGQKNTLVMGSYGLGLSRIIAACIEVMSSPDQIRWPRLIAPFSGVIIPPKEGSKEAEVCGDLHYNIYENLNKLELFHNDILLDDRSALTIGRKLQDCERMGYPWAVIIGAMAASSPSLLELRHVDKKQSVYLPIAELMHQFTYGPKLDDKLSV